MRALLIAVVAFALAGAALAQMGGKGGKRGGEPRGGQRESADVFHVVLEELRADLKLTPPQQPLWDAYVRKIDAFKADLARQRSRERAPAQGDAPRELDRLVDAQRDRLTALEDIAEAGRALYKTLDGDQKAIADARLVRLVGAASAEQVTGRPPPR